MADRWCESYVCEMSKSIKPWELAKEEVASQSIGRNFRSPRLFVFSRAHPAERFFAFGLRGKQVVIAHPMSAAFQGNEGDHFQPHYRMPFALMRGRKDGPFSIDLGASHCLLILWLSAAPPASYANVGSCRFSDLYRGFEFTPLRPRSLDCREIPQHLTGKCAKHARISRFVLDKPDCRERTAQRRSRSLCWFFSGWLTGSPVSGGH